LFRIFRVLGTPSEETWPGVTALQDWNEDFPRWPSLNMVKFVPTLGNAGLDLLEQLIVLDPKSRLSAIDCLNHRYFADMMTEN
jgi:serine/threonine protein kinase